MSSDLIMRAEQGVLGAMLTRTRTDLIANNLVSDDFGHPTHQAVYTALLDAEFADYETLDNLTVAIAGMVEQPGVDATWLRQVAEQTPGDDLVLQYTRIVVQASFDREVGQFADPYRAAAQDATDADRAALTRLADALDAQNTAFAAASAIDPIADFRLTADLNIQVDAQIRVELHREDQIVADIVQHPDQAKEVARWLDSAIFTTEQRKTTFELAVSLAYDDDPYDVVTLAWQVQRLRQFTHYDNPDQPIEAPAENDYSYLNRLQAATVTTGTAVVIGRQLLTEHVQATLALQITAASEHTTLAAAPHNQQQARMQAPMSQQPAIDIRPIEL
jgi:replicative DNA helicase